MFPSMTAHFPVFEFLALFDRQMLRFRSPRISRVLRAIDNAIPRLIPSMRKYSYRVIVELGTGRERPQETQ
jgi:hypothetical protein